MNIMCMWSFLFLIRRIQFSRMPLFYAAGPPNRKTPKKLTVTCECRKLVWKRIETSVSHRLLLNKGFAGRVSAVDVNKAGNMIIRPSVRV